MINYKLRCDIGHEFESSFASIATYEKLESAHALGCPICGSLNIARAPMAPAIGKSRGDGAATAAQQEQMRAYMKAVRELYDNSVNVGEDFPAEARRMHHGEDRFDGKRIVGEASNDEAEKLQREGVQITRLPRLPKLNS